MLNQSENGLINLTMLIAEEKLPSVLRKMGIEDTMENRQDILALTLNSLPTKYVTTSEGKQYSQLIEVYRLQYETDITASITKSCMRIMENPRDTMRKEQQGGSET
ncbi:MAG: late competence development ComFB family protein [Clostridiales Family XIII bacterium]|jgi:competence protein ComFB|nr:late competence development ComFB family protein [Clostridiales Family XIII bacterium]